MSNSAIDITDLTVRYGEVEALSEVTASITSGVVTGLLGTNGSGKSTLFSSIMGLVQPTCGSIRIFDGEPAAARRVGNVAYVPQSDAVDRHFPISVHDVVMMGRYGQMGATRRPRRADVEATASAIHRVGMTEFADRRIGQLSGGQRRRAFVARGIAQQARLILLDEPFAGVDVGSQRTITTLLRQLSAEGRTILISTHDLAGVSELCDEALLLHRRLLYSGPAAGALTPERLALTFEAHA